MARRWKLSRDQRRQQKLAKRRQIEPIEPYDGNKYRSERFVEALMEAEIGIYEAFVMTQRKLTDHEVKQSIQSLIRELRGEKLTPDPSATPPFEADGQPVHDPVVWRIKAQWDDFFQDRPRHCNSDLAGILRTILHSIGCWSRPVPNSQGYLKYVGGFLNQAGVTVQSFSEEEYQAWKNGEPIEPADTPQDEGDEQTAEEVLTELADEWFRSGEPMAKREFMAEARALIDEGEVGVVIEVCQRLIGLSNDREIVDELQELLRACWKQEPPTPRPRGLLSWLSDSIF